MTFWLLAAAIALSVFGLAALAASAAVAILAPAIHRRYEDCSPSFRATLLFAIRMLPAALAIVLALAVALPIFLAYEPRETDESIALTLIVLASLGAGLIVRGACRAVTAWRATSAVRHEWQRRGRRVDGFEMPLPLFAIDEPFPTVAVVGVTSPVLFISEQVLRACPADQVRAMLRHEAAHVAVRDNLKRFVMRACPDLLGPASALDRAWSSAAEEAADAAVVADRPAAALDLADALIRVARLAPARTPELASAFYLGGSIESRVRRLLAPAPAADASSPFVLSFLAGTCACIAAGVVLTAPSLHAIMEQVVRLLP
jgi:hypothetical protein